MMTRLRGWRGRMSYSNQRWFREYYGYRARWALQRLRFAGARQPAGGWPIILNMSFPKSGTNLMGQVIRGFTKVGPFVDHSFVQFAAHDPRTGMKRSEPDALEFLDTLHPLDLATAHMPAMPKVLERVCTPAFVPYFIYRDPRDVAVSHVFYVSEMAAQHHLHHYYTQELKSFDERLTASILGRSDGAVDFPNIGERFAVYTDWLNHPQVLCLRFEQFVHNRPEALGAIADHFLRRVDTLPVSRERLMEALESGIDPSRSRTFRSGKTGEWRQYFTPEHKRLFKEVAGDLLLRLGYEKDAGW